MKPKQNTKKTKSFNIKDFLFDIVKENIKKIAGIVIFFALTVLFYTPAYNCIVGTKEIRGKINDTKKLVAVGNTSEALDAYKGILEEVNKKSAHSFCCKGKYIELTGEINLLLGDYYADHPNDTLGTERNFNNALDYYETAHEKFTYDGYPLSNSEINTKIGDLHFSYSYKFNRVENLDNALRYYSDAVRPCDDENVIDKRPYNCEDIYAKLGDAYYRYSDVESKEDNLDRAIDYYEKSKALISIAEHRFEYANMLLRVGCAYCSLAEVTRTKENLEEGIKRFDKALAINTVEKKPKDYAMAQSNRGSAYLELYDEQKDTSLLNKGHDSIRSAQKIFTKSEDPYDYAATELNLALYYMKLFTVANNTSHLYSARDACTEAETIFKIDKYPYDYAKARFMLGVIHLELFNIRRRLQDILTAIECLKDAAEIYTPHEFPYAHAETVGYLGKAYIMLAEEGISNEENITRAEDYLNEAGEFYSNVGSFGDLPKHSIDVKNELMKLEELK